MNENITSVSYYRQIEKHIKRITKWKQNQKKAFSKTYLYQKYLVLASIFLVVWTCVFLLQHNSPSLLGVICLCLLEPFQETVDLHHLSSCSWQSSVYSFLEENFSGSLSPKNLAVGSLLDISYHYWKLDLDLELLHLELAQVVWYQR